jgi:hypothetical protein
MRFMFIVKSAHAGPPPPALLEAMHKLANREIKAGRMLDNGAAEAAEAAMSHESPRGRHVSQRHEG